MAGGATIGALRFVLGADTAAFERGLGNAQQRLKQFGADVARTAAVAATAFAAVGVAVAAGVGKALKEGEQLHRLSQQIGMSTEALSVLKQVADDSGVSLESFTRSMGRLSRTMAEAQSDIRSTAARTFEALGVS